MKIKSIVFFICFISTISYGQTKVGTVDSELIIGLMPETKKVLTMLSDYAKRLDSSYQVKVKDYQDKVAAFQKIEKDISDNFKKIKIDEIAGLERDLNNSQQNGNKLVQLKRDELMRPLYRKLSAEISAVAKANNFTQILTTSGNEFAYLDESFDITKLVMERLGIEIPEPETKN